MRAINIHAQLLYQLPEAQRTNAELASVYLDIPLEEFIAASMKLPALITSRPQTLADKAPLVRAIAMALALVGPLRDALRQHPAALMYTKERLKMRLSLAKAQIGQRSLPRLLIMSARHAEALLTQMSI